MHASGDMVSGRQILARRVGWNLDNPRSSIKEPAKNDRAEQMLTAGVITLYQYRKVNLVVNTSEIRVGGQSFRHFAETLPFMFVQW